MQTLRKSIFEEIEFEADQQTTTPTAFVDGPNLRIFKKPESGEIPDNPDTSQRTVSIVNQVKSFPSQFLNQVLKLCA